MNPASASAVDFPPVAPVSSRRKIAVLATGLLALAALGWIDYFTGYELGFFVFYSVPVGLTAWYGGRWPGFITPWAHHLPGGWPITSTA